ncbi:hypothetical protein O9993_10020 [Vibrio lentus]|nr:hypothetical protein [Vibrio lentus]
MKGAVAVAIHNNHWLSTLQLVTFSTAASCHRPRSCSSRSIAA